MPEDAPKKRFPLWAKIGIVLVILSPAFCVGNGMLATLIVPNVVRQRFVGPVLRAKSDVISIAMAINEYAVSNNGRYPATLEDLIRPDAAGRTYLDLESVPTDPWGNRYVYEAPRPGAPEFRVLSYGSDGRPGGEGDARDIDNRTIADGETPSGD